MPVNLDNSFVGWDIAYGAADCTGGSLWLRNTLTGEEHPWPTHESIVPTQEMYHGIVIRRCGEIATERDLPWPPEHMVMTGDTYHVVETGFSWVWMGDCWEEVRTITYPDGGYDGATIDARDIDIAPVGYDGTTANRVNEELTQGFRRHLRAWEGQLPDVDRNARVHPQYDDARVGFTQEEMQRAIDAVADAGTIEHPIFVHTGDRYYTAADVKKLDTDTSTDTTPEAFVDIFEVGA